MGLIFSMHLIMEDKTRFIDIIIAEIALKFTDLLNVQTVLLSYQIPHTDSNKVLFRVNHVEINLFGIIQHTHT